MTAPAVTRIQSRRRLIVVVLLALAVVGAVIRQFADPASLSHDLGTLLLVLWVPAVGNIIGYLRMRFARRPPVSAFAPQAEFVAERLAEVRFDDAAPDLSQPLACTLLQGSEAFTARLRSAATGGPGTPSVELQFLVPSVALPRFTPGTEFRIVFGRTVVGEGRVR